MGRRTFVLAITLLVAGCSETMQGAPTFAKDVAPIVYRSCTPCHRQGEPVPFTLLGYADVRKKGEQIVDVTQQRVMPPWLMTHGEFEGDRRLRVEEIETLKRWVDAGMPRGDAAGEPPAPTFPAGWQLREPDLVIEPREALVVPAKGPNVFRNLVIPVDAGTLRYVEAVEIRPGSAAVHHAVLAVDATRESRRQDALDAEPGFPGMATKARPPDGHFLGWTPGKRVRKSAPGMAWRLWPGQDLVLQLHLVPTGKEEQVRPRIGLYFTDVPTKVEMYPFVLFDDRIDIAAGATDVVLRDRVTVPVPIVVHTIYPHAHYLCRRMRGTATLPDGTSRDLFRIDAWDFDWQDDYHFKVPIALPAGTTLAFEYGFDNSANNPQNPHKPPQRVTFGQESQDEMATLTFGVTTSDLADRRRLAEASLRRDLEKNGWDPFLWVQLAGVLREQGRQPEALDAVREALQRQPENAVAQCELGLCLEVARDVEGAERAFREALRLDSEQSIACIQLGTMLGRSGRTGQAIELFEAALVAHPNLAPLHNNLATAYFALGRHDRAEGHYRRALDLDATQFGAWFNLGRVLAEVGRKDEARTALQRALALRPGDAAAAKALAELGR